MKGAARMQRCSLHALDSCTGNVSLLCLGRRPPCPVALRCFSDVVPLACVADLHGVVSCVCVRVTVRFPCQVLSDWCDCPQCGHPSLYSAFVQYISTAADKACCMCAKPVNLAHVQRIQDPRAKLTQPAAESKGGKDGAGAAGADGEMDGELDEGATSTAALSPDDRPPPPRQMMGGGGGAAAASAAGGHVDAVDIQPVFKTAK